jgi:excisionase family DNA binding protein
MNDDRLLHVREAAQFLGVAPGSLYHMVSQRRVPCIRLGNRCLRFRMSDLKRLIDEKFVPAK